MSTRLTLRRLRALDAAATSMAAGMQGSGDWPEDVTREDLDAALDWIDEQIAKRERPSND